MTSATVDQSTYGELGYVTVDWSTYALVGTRDTYNLNRTDVVAASTVQLYSGPLTSFVDWFATSDTLYEYEVTQTGGGNPEIFDGPVEAYTSTDYYWLLHPTDDSYRIKLQGVIGESFGSEFEEGVTLLMDRGRHVDYGTEYGLVGSLSCKLRNDDDKTARERRKELEELKALRSWVYLRNPFGDMPKVSLGKIDFNRIPGVGHREDVEVSIPYMEVM